MFCDVNEKDYTIDVTKIESLITDRTVAIVPVHVYIKIGYNKIINTIAASTFGVLLIHANSNTMRRWLWQDTFNNVGAYESGNVVIHAVVSVVLIYAVCTVIDLIRIRLVENPIMHQLDKINI